MGITSPLQPVENTSDGNSVAAFDTVPDPEDVGGVDVNPHFSSISKESIWLA